MKTRLLVLLLAITAGQVLLVVPALSAQTPQCPFTRGFNLAGWFQGESAKEIGNSYTITDLENMVALGADHVRVPIDLYNMSGGGPGYVIDPILFVRLDRLVDWCEELGLYVLLDNHSHLTLGEDPERRERLIAVWRQMAQHFKDRSELVLYEILNEPIGMPTAEWGEIQGEAIDAIRAIDSTHTVIVSPAELGSYDSFDELPNYADANLIYTFHFYDPFLFTHQATNWTDPSLENVTGVPYPYDAGRMPTMPRGFAGTWLGQLWDWYDDAGTPASVAQRMSIPVQFGDRRRAPIHCGELGVWQFGADPDERAQWYADVRALLDANGIPWTMWGYKGGFGIYQENSAGTFPDDLDVAVVEALGLDVPSTLEIHPDTEGLVIYDDLVSKYLFDGGYSGTLDVYDTTDPAEGAFTLHWTGAPRYSAITWRFTNPRDLSQLEDEGYRIRFWIKTDSPGLRFDLRFLDTDLGDGRDHPWRMVKTIDSNLVPMDGQWHEVEFALNDMVDAGSFDNNTWYSSEGKFDWTRVDQFEIVAEHQGMYGKNLWLDDIQIVAPPNENASAGGTAGANLLANGDFSSGMASWDTYIHEASGIDAQFVVYAGVLNAYILGVGTDPWNVQLIQHGIPLVQGVTYIVEFTAWADDERSINVALTHDSGDFDSYATETIVLTTEPTSYRFTFEMTAGTDLAALCGRDGHVRHRLEACQLHARGGVASGEFVERRFL